jgi:streptogramin lyase
LSVTISSPCVAASRWIYAVDNVGIFWRFDPATSTFTKIGALNCPAAPGETPFSMAVDQNAVAWVVYTDGNLYKVDTGTGRCEATSFQVEQYGFLTFGMGFVFDPSTGIDTLYIAADESNDMGSELATLSFPSLEVTPIGPIAAGSAELTGTGDGSLWGFVPSWANPDRQAVLVRLDPTSGATLEQYAYPSLPSGAGPHSWAVKFWGGSFWIFLDGLVYEVPRATPQTIRPVITDTTHNIVGAGVSTCAPLF